MTDLITFLDNNGKVAIYTSVNTYGLYCYLKMIGATTTLTTSGHRYHYFGPSYYTTNDTATLHLVI